MAADDVVPQFESIQLLWNLFFNAGKRSRELTLQELPSGNLSQFALHGWPMRYLPYPWWFSIAICYTTRGKMYFSYFPVLCWGGTWSDRIPLQQPLFSWDRGGLEIWLYTVDTPTANPTQTCSWKCAPKRAKSNE